MNQVAKTIAREMCMFRDMEDVTVYNTSKANTITEESSMQLYNLANLARVVKPCARGLLIGAGAVAVNGLFGGDTSHETYALGMKIGAGVETIQFMGQLVYQYLKND